MATLRGYGRGRGARGRGGRLNPLVKGDGGDGSGAPAAAGDWALAVAPGREFGGRGLPRALEPKVLVPFAHTRGQVPRKIEIERKRREYEEQDVSELLRVAGVGLADLANRTTLLPLQIFDDTSFDCRTPAEWMHLGQDEGGQFTFVPAKALRYERQAEMYGFRFCRVVQWDEGRNELRVVWQGGAEDEAGPSEWLPRIHIQFLAEDPTTYVQRILYACEQRQRAMALMRYRLYVDSMPIDGPSTLEPEAVHRIRQRAGNFTAAKSAVDVGPKLGQLVDEMQLDWGRSMNQIMLASHLGEKDIAELVLASIGLKKEDIVEERKRPSAVPTALYPIPSNNDFDTKNTRFMFNTYYNQAEVIQALTLVKAECTQLLKGCLFNLPKTRTMRLEDFEDMQLKSIEKMSVYLKTTWKENLKKGITASLTGMGKGWLNLHEKSKEIYEISKLKRFLTTVKYMMEDTIYSLVKDSCRKYMEFIEDVCEFTVTVKNMTDVHVAYPGSDHPNPIDKNPLFLVDLIEKDAEFSYSTTCAKFESTILALFDKAILATHEVPQLEKYVMEQYFWRAETKGPFVESVTLEDVEVQPWRERVRLAMARSLEPLQQYLTTYRDMLDLVTLDKVKYIEAYAEEGHSTEEMKQEIQKHLKRKRQVLQQIPYFVSVGNFSVDCHTFRHTMANKCQEIARLVMDLINKCGRVRANKIREEFAGIATKCQKKPTSVEVLYANKDYIKTVPEAVAELTVQISDMNTFYNVLEVFQYGLNDEDFKSKWEAIGWPKKLQGIIEAVLANLEVEGERFREILAVDQEAFLKDVDKMQRTVATFSKHTDLANVGEISAQVKVLQKTIRELQEKAQDFNKKQMLFGEEVKNYKNVFDMSRELQPYASLWITANDWLTHHQTWHTDPFESLDGEEIERIVTNSHKTMVQLSKTFKDKPPLMKIVEEIRKQVDEFKPVVPIVTALRNPGMKDRHWDNLSTGLGMEVRPKETLNTLKDVYPLVAFKDKIVKTCEVAAKEWDIESRMHDMQVAWESKKFHIEDYKATKTYIMKGSDEIQVLLDEHLNITQQLSFSPFKAYFTEAIDKWEYNLNLMNEILEQWLECQRAWLYLEPIFSSDDIAVQLPVLSKKFDKVNQTWRKIMGMAHNNPMAMSFCTTTHKLLEQLSDANKALEVVQKGLQDYLGEKRQSFARFYFLSDEELLEILSQSKDPVAIQPHLKKIFECIHSLEFSPDTQIEAWFSSEGERIPLDNPFIPKGNVEFWLGTIQSTMKSTVRHQVFLAWEDYLRIPRKEWVLKWPGQVVIAAGQIYWTKETEDALVSGGTAALGTYTKKLTDQLMELVFLVQGDLIVRERINLGALITIELHGRDVMDNMYAAEVSKVTDFEWMSQLRYYWENDDCYIKQVDSVFRYGGEYLGNSMRLVITPLTDRIYLTLTGALSMFLGGAPAGPAGTGKTETTKDLAKALAKQCVVFNCQEGLDFRAMAKFFKGLAMAGAWACFDEFNRIDVEVLSVVAQQVNDIQQAAITRNYRIEFEGSDILVDPTNAVFITMNPGYAGRTELPDNLKVLFRPVACMVPDYALIGEIRLFSFGYTKARALARKMVATFRLSSEQLSSQDHYDYGMRAVNTVISAAGLMKRENRDGDEDLLLLRALRDSNLPKFLKEDIALFEGIISDLFPGAVLPTPDYGVLMEYLLKTISQAKLQPVPNFITKCIQLYEMTVLRHGLMTVGPTGGGKTSALRTLQAAMSSIAAKKDNSPADAARYPKVRIHTCNPKSITMNQLYGAFDEATHEWADGVLCTLFRRAAQDLSGAKNWVMFDGPVDALWIESMNTVLDENKKLCLVSGEIIQMSRYMTMMFEVEDLAVASPATVSRCGMIYMQPNACVGTDAQVQSWLDRQLPVMKAELARLKALFGTFMQPCLDFVQLHCHEYVPAVMNNLVCSCFRLLDAFIVPYIPVPATANPTKETQDKLEANFPSLFFLSLIWSVGATVDGDSRVKFDAFLRDLMKGNETYKVEIPSSEDHPSVYDYFYTQDEEERGWIPWVKTQREYAVDRKLKFHDILVPTKDTIRSTWLLEHLLAQRMHVLCVGPTGTGKTMNIQQKLMSGMSEKFVPLFVNFSAQTSSNQLQNNLMSKFEKRRKDTFGAPAGKTFVVFVDDANMPQKEQYGAQPPIELLRQYLDHGGFYQFSPPIKFLEIIDIVLVNAMGPPGGGRNPISNRYLRHFNHIAFPELEMGTMMLVFRKIMQATLGQDFPAEIKGTLEPLLKSTVNLFYQVAQKFLPLPAHVQYTFNLRDVARCFTYLYNADPKHCKTKDQWARLWCHECFRVYGDRMIKDEHKNQLIGLIDDQLKENWEMEWASVVTAPRLIYWDFLVPGADPRVYSECSDMDQLVKVMEEYLDDYNRDLSPPMPLIMFLDCIEHCVRLCRTIRQYNGHCLLLGIGGSGRRSCTRLAAYICEYEPFTVEITKSFSFHDWRENLKSLLNQTGMEDKQLVFIFTDTQIIKSVFLEDVANLLNSGDVPNLYEGNDLEAIYNAMRPICAAEQLPQSKVGLYSRFIKNVKANLHIVLAFSPIGDIFRARMRMFPPLVNCCAIDWVANWPDDALTAVARNQMDRGTITVPDEMQDSVIHMFVFIHASVGEMSERYRSEAKRHNYVTPTSFLSILECFERLLQYRKKEVTGQKLRLMNGLEKLRDTEAGIEGLQLSLQESQPILIRTQEEIKVMMGQIAVDKKDAEAKREVALQDEAEAQGKANECNEIKASAQAVLDEALPALDNALKVLKNLKVKDISEVGKYQNPPEGVKFVMEVVCKMKGLQPKKVGEAGKKRDDWWDPSRTLLTNAADLQNFMLTYDKDNIPESLINKIRPYIDDERFQPAKVREVSVPCTAMCQWVHAMFKYYHVNLEVAPKRAALAGAEAELAVVMAKLEATRAGLKLVEDRVAELQRNYDAAIQKQQDLQNQVKLTELKLMRANRLINGLAGEKNRWVDSVAAFTEQEGYLVGDTLVAAGAVAYLGPFMAEFRRELSHTWLAEIDHLGINHGKDVTLTHTTGDPVVIQQWHLFGLPSDPLSVENGVILFNSSRWPLCIDPQGQANAWIKNMQRDQRLVITKLSDKDYAKQLENAIRMGYPCLLENVGEDLDPMLEPLLLRQTFVNGNTTMIKLGENNVPWDEKFRLFLTTKLPNPHYSPETCVKVGLLNFFITPSGLEDQLLAKIVGKERKDLEDEKKLLTASNANMAKELKELQETILRMLQEAEGDILEQEDLILTLERSKLKSEEIKKKVDEAKRTELVIDEARSKYRPVAFNGSTLFFCVSSLSMVDPMYQYSLQWFNNLFLSGIDNTEPNEDLDVRLQSLIDYFTYSFYNNVCRSLFEMHKLMFSFSLCVALLRSRKQVDELEYRFFLAGAISTVHAKPNPAPDWLTEACWSDLQYISTHLPAFEGFSDHFAEQVEHYRRYFDDADAHRYPLHGEWDEKLSLLEKLIVCRCVRADKVVQGMQDFVCHYMAERYIIPPSFDLAGSFKDSDATSPLIFVLVPGADPMADLLKFAEQMKMNKKLHSISLGQGQGKKAEMMIQEGIDRGTWVLLQNCHLAVTWMPMLEIIVERFSPETMKKEFRLWLTSMPSPLFPVSVLQVGVKMTNEPPKGLRNNVTGNLAAMTDEYLEESKQPVAFKKLLFSLLLFHAIIQDRRKFGPLGWNIPYEFTTADLKVNLAQLHHFLEVYDSVPYIVIKFLVGQINYGGRITDDKDRRCIMTLLDGFVDERIMDIGYSFSESGLYRTVEPGNRQYYLDVVREWPLNSAPEVFGLHSNADITCARNETFLVLETILATQVGASNVGGRSKDEVLGSLAGEIKAKVPPEFDIVAFTAKYPILYEQSMNTVLAQEATRFNRLLEVMHRSLKEFGRAIKGEVVMSMELDAMGNAMFNNQIPALWAAKAYPSLRSLSAWVEDLVKRCRFIQNWYDNGVPRVFWFSGFYFPQAFLTGSLQNYARKLKISIDTLSFDFEIQRLPAAEIQAPEDGVMVDGLSMEGARWDMESWSISESRPKELFTDMPVVWLRPLVGRERPEGVYSCPVYKTLRRAGVLSTSGHSTNYVIGMDIPSVKPEAHWIGRGVACFCEVL